MVAVSSSISNLGGISEFPLMAPEEVLSPRKELTKLGQKQFAATERGAAVATRKSLELVAAYSIPQFYLS